MEEKTIQSLDDLFIYAYEVEQGISVLQPIRLDGDFSLRLHVKGDSWDKRIDERSAQYIISLQAALDNLLEEYSKEVDRDKLLVKVATEEGSLLSSAEITPFLSQLVSSMTEPHIFIAVMTTIAAISGVTMWSRYQARKERIELEQERTKQIEAQEATRQKEEEQETERESVRQETLRAAFNAFKELADSSPEQYGAYERPIRGLVKTMGEQDRIIVGETKEEIPALSAKGCGPRRASRSSEEITYADGMYTVNSRRYDEGEVVLELEQGSTTIKAYLWQFDENDRERFIESLDRHEREDTLPFSMELQLNVIHTKRKLKHAVIIGEGRPREGKRCVPLDEILSQ